MKRGLALSGGGYRASLFHLGALTRLHELGIAKSLTRISSVSGGSIIAAHLAHSMLEHGNGTTVDFGSAQDWEDIVARPFREFAGKDARTWPTIAFAVWGQLKPTLRANYLRNRYEERLTDKKLNELPTKDQGVEFVFLATDMSSGTSWRFGPREMYSYKTRKNPVGDTTIATAATASACFPPLFGPMRLETPNSGTISLTDGGVYDNSGMEPVWKGHDLVLVSDAGQPWDTTVPRAYTGKLMRYANIATNQVRAQRQRALVRMFKNAPALGKSTEGALWRLSSDTESFLTEGGAALRDTVKQLKADANNFKWYGYDDEAVLQRIYSIRTDLDVFTELEAKVLENHGYYFADLAIRTHLSGTYPIPSSSFKPPHPDFLRPDERLIAGLKNSHSRTAFWKRWFS